MGKACVSQMQKKKENYYCPKTLTMKNAYDILSTSIHQEEFRSWDSEAARCFRNSAYLAQ